MARTLQEGLLPDRLAEIPRPGGRGPATLIADGGEVGGDLYDCFAMSLTAGCSRSATWLKKGTAAAVLTGLARHTLRAIAQRDERPEDMLRFLNEAMRSQSSETAFCTVGLVRLDGAPGGFAARLAFGGHPYPLLVRAGGGVEEVAVRGTLVGVEADSLLEPVELALRATTRWCSTPTASSTPATRPHGRFGRPGCTRPWTR